MCRRKLLCEKTKLEAAKDELSMNYGLVGAAILLIGGMGGIHFVYDKSGDKKEKYFLCAVIFEILLQSFLIYEYVHLRGGFAVAGCVYGVTLALAMGALILWGSRMLFSFSHEGFRVLLGVCAIVAGYLGGSGIDMVIAFESGMSAVHSYSAAMALCVGAVSVMLSDIAVIVKNFSVKDRRIYRIIFDITSAVGIVMIFYGAVMA